MSCINQVVLVGRLVRDPEFAETSQHKRFARLAVETEKFVRVGGESRRVAMVHAVVCFNQFSLPPLEQAGRAGSFVKVLGELGQSRDGKAEIVVSQYSGEVGLMSFGPVPQASAPAAPAGGAASQPTAGETAAGAPAPSATRSLASGGLGRLAKRQQGAERQDPNDGPPPPAPGGRAPQGGGGRPSYDPLDDEIPFRAEFR